jgi:lipopolysaccharide/colanic/teichoic acid biosynthesis glycosyltransferase
MRTSQNRGLPHVLEIVLCIAVLVALLPVLALTAVLIRITSPGPILFRHERIGRYGRVFRLVKFRTMRHGDHGPAVTARGDSRITPVGRLLRKTKLDELPELWNVVRGDMSLVGPRPEAVDYANSSAASWHEVLTVRPGITDPMTLRLRNEEELLAAARPDPETFYRCYLLPYKLNGYREYLADRTWRRDIQVLCQTMLAIAMPRRVPAPSPEQIVMVVTSGAAAGTTLIPARVEQE